jgi:hypothetical protein
MTNKQHQMETRLGVATIHEGLIYGTIGAMSGLLVAGLIIAVFFI